MRVVAFGLASAFSWGVADYIAGLESRRNSHLAVGAVAQLTGLVLVSVALVYEGLPTPSALVLAIGAAVGICSGLGSLTFYRAMGTGSISIVAPIAAAGAAIPVLASIIRGENPSLPTTSGVVLTIAGVVLSSRIPPREPPARAADRHTIVLALVTALCIGAFLIGLSEGANRSLVWTLWLQRFWSLTLMIVATRLTTASFRLSLDRVAPTLGVGAFTTAAPAFFAAAAISGSLSVASVTSSLHSVITVVLAAVLLRERVLPIQRAGTVLAIGGVLLLSATS